MKKTLALASIVLLAGSLTACGGGGNDNASGGGGDSYCNNVKDVQSTVKSLDFSKLDDAKFQALQDGLNSIEDSAPADIKPDWTTLSDAIDQLNGILSDAGLSFDDLQAIQNDPSNLPDGVDLSKLQDLAKKLNAFSTNTDFQDAADKIQANVKDVCGIDLNADGSSTTGS